MTTWTDLRPLLLLLAAGLPLVGSAITVGPEEISALVRQNSDAIRADDRRVGAALRRTGHLGRSLWPTGSATVGGEAFQTGPYGAAVQPYGGIEGRWNLYRTGRDRLEESLRREEVRLSTARKALSEQDLVHAAQGVYWRIAARAELSVILKEALESNQKTLQTVNRRIARGVTTETDRLEFQLNQSQLEEELRNIEDEAKIETFVLRDLLGLPESEPVQLAVGLSHQHDPATGSGPAGDHPRLATLSATGALLTHQQQLASRWWGPSVDAYGGFYLHTLRDRDFRRYDHRDEVVLGLRLTVPFWDGGTGRAEAAAHGLEVDALAADVAHERRLLRRSARVAEERMGLLHGLIHAAEERIVAGANYLAKTLSEYDRGVKNSPDVLGAMMKQLGHRKRLVEIKLQYQLAKADLRMALGR